MRGERGSVSVVVAAVILMVLVLSLGLADVAHVLVARSHARTAADSAALAVAQELLLPTGVDPAVVAATYAAMNGASLTRCDCTAGTLEATVAVSITVGGFLLILGERMVTARARAVVDPTAGAPREPDRQPSPISD